MKEMQYLFFELDNATNNSNRLIRITNRNKFENIKFTQEPIKILGRYFGFSKNECLILNLQRPWRQYENLGGGEI